MSVEVITLEYQMESSVIFPGGLDVVLQARRFNMTAVGVSVSSTMALLCVKQ